MLHRISFAGLLLVPSLLPDCKTSRQKLELDAVDALRLANPGFEAVIGRRAHKWLKNENFAPLARLGNGRV